MIKYERRLSNLAEIYSYLPDEKDRDTILGIFNKRYDENYISDYLAFVLDPDRNGIGAQPLNKILDYFTEEDNSLSKDDNIEINREFTLSNNRRIDLLININDSLIIGIENKVFAAESQNQTSDYAKNIKNMFGDDKDYLFIFLTKGGKEAASEEFMSLTYKNLVSLLKKVVFDFSENIRKSIYYQDFIIHLEEFIMRDNAFDITKKTELYIKNKKMIQDLQESFNKNSEMIFNYIKSYIRERVREKFNNGEWQFDFSRPNTNRSYQQIFKNNWNSHNNLRIHFEYHFHPYSLLSENEIAFMLDIEDSNKERFINLLEENNENYSFHFKEKGIETVSKKGRIAYKTYKYKDIKKDLPKIIDKSLEEFEFFIELVDNTFDYYPEGDSNAR